MKKFALYYVPDVNDSFYRLGSSIVGRDLWNDTDCAFPSELDNWKNCNMHTYEYGLHLTVGDAIYFDEHKLSSIIDEIETLLKVSDPDVSFILTPSEGESFIDFRGKSNDALVLGYDANIPLIVFHTLVVARLHPLGDGSLYTHIKKNDPDQYSAHEGKRIDLFHTYHGLENFRPHFSLLNPCPKENREDLVATINGLFRPFENKVFEVNKLALLVQDEADSPFYIVKTFNREDYR
ncbi:MAG: DUF1045 domain-containing protein [Bacteriovoracaceae bacterium]|nr:DUF1045 domain-containing protein [Bacteriovoracaceae bacterium]